MEGIVMEFRWVLDAMEKSSVQILELRAVEGVTISPIWNQLLANILQRPVCIPKIKDATLSGAAQCAAVALGDFKDFQESARSWVKPNQIFEPDPGLSQTYQDLFEVFVSSYDSLRRNDIFGRLRKLES